MHVVANVKYNIICGEFEDPVILPQRKRAEPFDPLGFKHGNFLSLVSTS